MKPLACCVARPISIVSVLFFLVQITMAQEEESATPDRLSLSFYGIAGIPSRQFKEAVDNSVGGMSVGLGLDVMANVRPGHRSSPVWLGGEFGYSTFGRDKIPATADAPPYKTTFNLYTVSGVARLMPKDQSAGFVPFADLSMGLRVFNTRTKIDKDLFGTINDDEPEVINNTNSAKLGYAAGVGFVTGKGFAGFTLKVSYLWGYTLKYVKRGSLAVDNGVVYYETGHTKADMFQIQLGIRLHG